MIVRVVCTGFMQVERRRSLRRRGGLRAMGMSFAPVHELAVLGALRVLDQEHVPGA